MSPGDADDSYVYVDSDDTWRRAADVVERAAVLAVDTEADSMHSYFEKVCLIQLRTDGGDAFIVDPLAVEDLRALGDTLADPRSVTVFHGADFDVTSLRRDFGFAFAGLFDTMVAAQFLGDAKVSLQDLVERFFGVRLSKGQTRTDWGRRPLTPQQLEYSFLDVRYLVELYRIQDERLREADLHEEAQIEFERLERREPAERGFDPHGWMRIKGSRNLAPEEQAVLAELHAVRDRHARTLDRPPFKVLSTDAMLRIATVLPESNAELAALKGLSSFVMSRMARDILKAVSRGHKQGAPPVRPREPPDPRRRLDFHGQRRLGRLRDWRGALSEKSGIATVAILPNYAMFAIAQVRPRSSEELADIDGVGTRRAEKWADAILPLVG